MRALCLATLLTLTTSTFAQDNVEGLLMTFRDDKELSLPMLDSLIATASQLRARALAIQGRLVHADATGRGVGLQMLAAGGAAGVYGEILGAGARLELVWKAWLASPEHRAVLVEPGWQTWGWGSYQREETTVWVLRFWKPGS